MFLDRFIRFEIDVYVLKEMYMFLDRFIRFEIDVHVDLCVYK